MTREYIELMVQRNDAWLERGILAIWHYQTQDEKRDKDTKYNNGVGFNGADGAFMTSLGNILNKGYHLSEKQKFIARKKMRKYSGQLLRIAEDKTNDAQKQINSQRGANHGLNPKAGATPTVYGHTLEYAEELVKRINEKAGSVRATVGCMGGVIHYDENGMMYDL